MAFHCDDGRLLRAVERPPVSRWKVLNKNLQGRVKMVSENIEKRQESSFKAFFEGKKSKLQELVVYLYIYFQFLEFVAQRKLKT